MKEVKTKVPIVLTIGHSARTWKDFLDLLRAHGVKRVVDIRSIPRIEIQPSVQPGDSLNKVAGCEDRLRVFAKAGRLASRTAWFPEHGLA